MYQACRSLIYIIYTNIYVYILHTNKYNQIFWPWNLTQCVRMEETVNLLFVVAVYVCTVVVFLSFFYIRRQSHKHTYTVRRSAVTAIEMFTFHMFVGVFFFLLLSYFNWIQLLHLSKFLFIFIYSYFLVRFFLTWDFWILNKHFNFVMYTDWNRYVLLIASFFSQKRKKKNNFLKTAFTWISSRFWLVSTNIWVCVHSNLHMHNEYLEFYRFSMALWQQNKKFNIDETSKRKNSIY